MELHLPARGSKRVRAGVVAAKKSRVLRIQMEKLDVCPNGCPALARMIRNLVYLARKNVALNEKIKHISQDHPGEAAGLPGRSGKEGGKEGFLHPL